MLVHGSLVSPYHRFINLGASNEKRVLSAVSRVFTINRLRN
jgi:hypothetical protein